MFARQRTSVRREANFRARRAEATPYIASGPVSPVRILTTLSMSETKILPSPILPVLAFSFIASMTLSAYSSVLTTISIFTLGMNSTIEALKTLGISEDEIETSRFNIYPIKDYERKTVEIVGYRVTNEIAVKTGDLDTTGEIIRAAINAGANKVRWIEFGLNETREKESKYAAIKEA